MAKHGLLWLFILITLLSQPTVAKRLMVGVVGTPPFVVDNENVINGISVQIWEAVADMENFEFELVMYDSEAQVLSDVKHGNLDVAIGPISITAVRAEEVDFTQPYYSADLGMLTHNVKKSLFQRAKPFLTKAFLYGVLFLLSLLAVVGALIWFTEKNENPEEFPDGARGLLDGMWFAIVTMTTVGYGDKCPRSGAGRLVTTVWMLIATISSSTLTAGIATALTLSSLDHAAIRSPEDMRGQRVGVITGTTGAAAARHYGATDVGCKDLNEAVSRLLSGTVDAVVFDMPALRYYVQQNPDDKYVLAKAAFDSQNYGFALNVDSDHLHEVNVALLALHENGQIREIAERWMSGSQQQQQQQIR